MMVLLFSSLGVLRGKAGTALYGLLTIGLMLSVGSCVDRLRAIHLGFNQSNLK